MPAPPSEANRGPRAPGSVFRDAREWVGLPSPLRGSNLLRHRFQGFRTVPTGPAPPLATIPRPSGAKTLGGDAVLSRGAATDGSQGWSAAQPLVAKMKKVGAPEG